MHNDKQNAALSSVFAAIFLTGLKTFVGFFTGSLGILSEALHSALDLGAALITFFAVKFSDKPADTRHHYGHGKIESFSALIEILLLVATCTWIIYESIEKIFFGKSIELIGIQWGILVMGISIIVDISRVTVLKKAAQKHKSQALEADALHFSSDVLSSIVVIIGLVCVYIGKYFNISYLSYSDPIAALGVAILIIKVSLKLAKETIAVLLDTAPIGLRELIYTEISKISGVLEIADIRIRPSGPENFIDIKVGVDSERTQSEVYALVDEIRKNLEKIEKSDIIISTFPVNVIEETDSIIYQTIKKIIRNFPICTNIHNVNLYETGDSKKISVHIEIKKNITLKESHDLAHKIANEVKLEIKNIDNVNIFFQCHEKTILAEDITDVKPDIVSKIESEIKKILNTIDCHNIKLYNQNNQITTFLHCELGEDITVLELDELSKNITLNLKNNIKELKNIHIHFEPKF